MTLYAVVLSERAKKQIDKARTWWQKRNPARVAAIDDDLAAAYERIERFPEIGLPSRSAAGRRREHGARSSGMWAMTSTIAPTMRRG
jgi:plasmid stabilization system protein ParE